MKSQHDVFAAEEADRWFERNQAVLNVRDDDPIVGLFEAYSLRPERALEVGCANGYRLATLKARFNSHAIGVEPSARAVADGKAQFPGIELNVGTADDLSILGARRFDAVIVNFVLHWVDRSLLLKVCAELDRVLEPGGMLVIGDFEPSSPCKVRYHHRQTEEVYTFKQSYRDIFLSTSLYSLISFQTFAHGTREYAAHSPSAEAWSLTLLRKEGIERYPTVSLAPAGNGGSGTVAP